MSAIDPKNKFFDRGNHIYLPNLSVDCVIFGFHNGVLKILLNKLTTHNEWMLPGGFIRMDEDVDMAAYRVLKSRTGLEKVYLKQFYLFGDRQRTNIEENKQMLEENNISEEDAKWFLQRFATLGYYAFIDYASASISNQPYEETEWFNIDEIPQLYSDHNKIINKAITTIRTQIERVPLGFELLPEKFTASELRSIYETILNKKLDRRNFQKKILSTGLIYKLEEVSKKWGIKSTTLFAYDREKYMKARENDDNIIDI